ncbi:MAG: hypothetical protein NTV40_10250 [Solirubrobacterales bacterium]|nr:hypothetical protein [Solirubrobacterales bacterium]
MRHNAYKLLGYSVWRSRRLLRRNRPTDRRRKVGAGLVVAVVVSVGIAAGLAQSS